MNPRLGIPATSIGLLDGIKGGRKMFGFYKHKNNRTTLLKRRLQNSRNRKAPITLPSTPFDHRGDKS